MRSGFGSRSMAEQHSIYQKLSYKHVVIMCPLYLFVIEGSLPSAQNYGTLAKQTTTCLQDVSQILPPKCAFVAWLFLLVLSLVPGQTRLENAFKTFTRSNSSIGFKRIVEDQLESIEFAYIYIYILHSFVIWICNII